MGFTRPGKKRFILSTDCANASARFVPVTRQFFAPSLYILYAADLNYLMRWVIVTYILLNISVVNLQATSAYEWKLLAVTSTWHYLPSIRLDNAGSVIRP